MAARDWKRPHLDHHSWSKAEATQIFGGSLIKIHFLPFPSNHTIVTIKIALPRRNARPIDSFSNKLHTLLVNLVKEEL